MKQHNPRLANPLEGFLQAAQETRQSGQRAGTGGDGAAQAELWETVRRKKVAKKNCAKVGLA